MVKYTAKAIKINPMPNASFSFPYTLPSAVDIFCILDTSAFFFFVISCNYVFSLFISFLFCKSNGKNPQNRINDEFFL